MVRIQNKATKKIRIVKIIFFLILIVLTTFPFWSEIAIVEGGLSYSFLSAMDGMYLILSHGSNTGALQFGLISLIFFLFPLIAVGFEIFDFYYNLKNIVGFVCSAAGIIAIVYLVGPSFLALGSLLSLLIYLFTAFMSVMGMFARALKVENTAPTKN